MKVSLIRMAALVLSATLMMVLISCKKDSSDAGDITTPPAPVATLDTITSSEALIDSIGAEHNQALENGHDVMVRLIKEGMVARDTIALKAGLLQSLKSFFTGKISSFPDAALQFDLRQPDDPTTLFHFNPSQFSVNGKGIVLQLIGLLSSYDDKYPEGKNDAAFFTSLRALKADALSKLTGTELIRVGGSISVALYSFPYWKANADRWYNDVAQASGNGSRIAFKCKLKWGSLGASDAVGALNGAAVGGIGAGPLAAVAGGILGAAGGSLGNIGGQILGCIWDWWSTGHESNPTDPALGVAWPTRFSEAFRGLESVTSI